VTGMAWALVDVQKKTANNQRRQMAATTTTVLISGEDRRWRATTELACLLRVMVVVASGVQNKRSLSLSAVLPISAILPT